MNSVDTGHRSVNGVRPEGLAGIADRARARDRAGAFHRLRIGQYRVHRADDDVITIERAGSVRKTAPDPRRARYVPDPGKPDSNSRILTARGTKVSQVSVSAGRQRIVTETSQADSVSSILVTRSTTKAQVKAASRA